MDIPLGGLQHDVEGLELLQCLQLPVQLGASTDWARLYGFPYQDQVPDLVARNFSAESYPELRQHMIAQFLAPFRGVTSIRRSIKRRHWRAT